MERSSRECSESSRLPKVSEPGGRELVLLTGTIPNAAGVGVEQRAAQTLHALERLGRVHIVYCGEGASRAMVHQLRAATRGSCVHVPPAARIDLGRWLRRLYLRAPRLPAPPTAVRGVLARAVGLEGRAPATLRLPARLLRRADYVHVFRLSLAPLAAAWLGQKGVRVAVDLDDLESETLDAIAALAEGAGERGLAWTYTAMAEAARRFEQHWLARVDRLGVCSEADRVALRARRPDACIAVLPNVLDATRVRQVRPQPGMQRELLFVGALGYYPNIDAIRFLVTEILPRLRATSGRFALHIAGRGAGRALRRMLAGVPDVLLHGSVPDLAPLYARAHVALCPVRAGGGTRIKILEAFAHGVPVVATRAGAAGLEVAHARELLLADDPGAFAEAIVALGSPPVATALSERARAFVVGHHDPRHFAAGICELAGACARGGIMETSS